MATNAGGTKKSPPLMKISRNKHWKYISSYSGPWLQLPIELLQHLYMLNISPSPSIDPVLFANLIYIRQLVENAADLSMRTVNNSSGARSRRTGDLVIRKLAEAYAIDEVLTSVVVMQNGATLIDQVVERMYKGKGGIKDTTPQAWNDLEYVHFFHEKIPSRHVAEYTPSYVLDNLVESHPSAAHYHRTRGIVNMHKQNFMAAVGDFTTAIKLSPSMAYLYMHAQSNQPVSDTARQCVFMRASSYLQHAIFVIDDALFNILQANGGSEFYKREADMDVPAKVKPVIEDTDAEAWRAEVKKLTTLKKTVRISLAKAIRDYKRWIALAMDTGKLCKKSMGEHAKTGMKNPFFDMSELEKELKEAVGDDKEGDHAVPDKITIDVTATTSTTNQYPYHPLLLEAHYALAICYLLLGDFKMSVEYHRKASGFGRPSVKMPPPLPFLDGPPVAQSSTTTVISMSNKCDTVSSIKVTSSSSMVHGEARSSLSLSSSEPLPSLPDMERDTIGNGYPVFLPARSMMQSDYIESYQRLKQYNGKGGAGCKQWETMMQQVDEEEKRYEVILRVRRAQIERQVNQFITQRAQKAGHTGDIDLPFPPLLPSSMPPMKKRSASTDDSRMFPAPSAMGSDVHGGSSWSLFSQRVQVILTWIQVGLRYDDDHSPTGERDKQ